MNKVIFNLFSFDFFHEFQSCKYLYYLLDFFYFFDSVTIDVNGKVAFSKCCKKLNSCI